MPNFQKRHYEVIANEIRQEVREQEEYSAESMILKRLASNFAQVFKDDNPNFSEQRFLDACDT